MNIAQIETNLQQLIADFNKDTFIFDFLLAYGLPKASIARLQKGNLNLSKIDGEIDWKKKIFFKAVEKEDVHVTIDTLKRNENIGKHQVRFIIVTDYKALVAIDTKTQDSLDIVLPEIIKHFDFFLPLAGMEKSQHQNENPADVKAAEKMAKLFDEIKRDNATQTKEEVHNLNVFLSRLLFCYFAEDTGIFEQGQFTNAIDSHTQNDGSDLNTYLDKLFGVMNLDKKQRNNLPEYLNAFPYVNGGLFRNEHAAPTFTRRSRQVVIECGELDWSAINPDIFGSMIQAVITPEHRGGLGMHYTSVPNIMKVIEPLFLTELQEEFEKNKDNKAKLKALLQRIWNIKIFDPACGSGNFLIIAYKELRRLEMKIFKQLAEVGFSEISLGNFYGIELDDFAHEVAILSLWLAEHQMNQEFFKEFGRTKPALPLMETGNIIQGNACRVDWEEVCRKMEGDEIYILGNPPYLGGRNQSSDQKQDMDSVFIGIDGRYSLDYIACWFLKASHFLKNNNGEFAFVSTNSICQGEQVNLLWGHILSSGLEIGFAHKSFKWTNNAKDKAAVICIIVGVRNKSTKRKILIDGSIAKEVNNISPYLTQSGNIIVSKRTTPLLPVPSLVYGNQAIEGGYLILNDAEKNDLIQSAPSAKVFIRPLYGADDYLNGKNRWCIWINENNLKDALEIPEINKRIQDVRMFRENGGEVAKSLVDISYRFRYIHEAKDSILVLPRTTSERRKYLAVGFLTHEAVITDAAQVIYDPEPYILGVLSSTIHMLWVKAVGGRLKMDPRYSNSLCYNTFPFPLISLIQKQELEKHVYRILEEREAHSEKTLAQLYDPEKMPEGLREAHRQNDLAIERCYRSKSFESDEERLEYLFKLYEKMIAEEQEKGGLFEKQSKKKINLK